MNAVPLAGKVAVVSGASRGLGKRICEARTELRGENIRVTILRSGRMSESGFNRHWPEARRVRYRELVQSQGFYAQSGEPISPQIAARAIVDVIRMPLDAKCRFVGITNYDPPERE